MTSNAHRRQPIDFQDFDFDYDQNNATPTASTSTIAQSSAPTASSSTSTSPSSNGPSAAAVHIPLKRKTSSCLQCQVDHHHHDPSSSPQGFIAVTSPATSSAHSIHMDTILKAPRLPSDSDDPLALTAASRSSSSSSMATDDDEHGSNGVVGGSLECHSATPLPHVFRQPWDGAASAPSVHAVIRLSPSPKAVDLPTSSYQQHECDRTLNKRVKLRPHSSSFQVGLLPQEIHRDASLLTLSFAVHFCVSSFLFWITSLSRRTHALLPLPQPPPTLPLTPRSGQSAPPLWQPEGTATSKLDSPHRISDPTATGIIINTRLPHLPSVLRRTARTSGTGSFSPLHHHRRPARAISASLNNSPNPIHTARRATSLPADFMMTPTTPTTPTHTLPHPIPTSASPATSGKRKDMDSVMVDGESPSSSSSTSPQPSSPSSSDDETALQMHHRGHRPFHHQRSRTGIPQSHSLSINVQLGPVSPYAPSSSTPSSSATTPGLTSAYFNPTPPHHASPGAPPVIPPTHPLITRETLKELELEVTLRSPQLRHDLLFDPGLQFRPTSGRRKREQTERYWEAVAREMESGCTCTSFDKESRLFPCVCGKATTASSSTGVPVHPAWHPLLLNTKSRIMPLLETLKEVLHLVIHPAPSSNSPAASSTSSSHTVDPILASFDPQLIQQEIAHGVFDHKSVFRWIGEVMKMHCAPMRDAMVEGMVKMGTEDGEDEEDRGRRPVRALRMCFEILEVMKLDIANHQLQALRPYLLDTSPEFELKTFQERFEKGVTALNVTRRWISRAAATIPPQPTRNKLVMSALCSAMVDLVFDPPAPTQPEMPVISNPPVTQNGTVVNIPIPARFLRNNNGGTPQSGYPETLYLDHARLASYVNDAADLMGLYMLIMLFRQLTTSAPSSPSSSLEDWEVDRIKREVWEVGPSRLGLCFDVVSDETKTAKWEKGMVDVMLQVATRAEEARDRMRGEERPTASMAPPSPPSPEILALIENWQKSNYRKGSPLQKIMKQRLRAAVLDVVKENAVCAVDGVKPRSNPSLPMRKVNRHQPTATATTTTTSTQKSSTGTGLEPLMPEILHLGERIARLVVFHAKVYGKLYEVDGFIDMAL